MEKRSLLHDEEVPEAEEVPGDVRIQHHGYGSSSSSDSSTESVTEEVIPGCISNVPFLVKVYRKRQIIPGYGLWRLLRQASAYSLYVLLIMLLAYLLNQLDRYTFSVTARYVGFDLGFGDLGCLPNFTSLLGPEYDIPRRVVYGPVLSDCGNSTIG